MEIDKFCQKFESEFNKRVGALEAYNSDKELLLDELRQLHADAKIPTDLNKLVTETLQQFRADYAIKYSEEITHGANQVMSHTGMSVSINLDFSRDDKQMLIKTVNVYPNGYTLEGKPEDIHGGGFRDVMAVIFAISYIMQKPALTGPIIMDEPTKQLSVGYSQSFYQYLQDTAAYLSNQVIMITHDTNIINDAKYGHNVIEVRTKPDGTSDIIYHSSKE